MTRRIVAITGLTAVVSFLLGLVAAGPRPASSHNTALLRPAPGDFKPLTVSISPAAPVASPSGAAAVDFATVAARLNAAVVNIDAAARGSDRGSDRSSSTPRRWQRDFGDDESSPREGSGSGFIVDPSGYVLTNHHVVDGADRITVTLGDGRSFRAEITGVDPAIDVALLHIDSRDKLPAAPLGDSEGLRVGEWVCAIGNPLGYVHSVTVGVVSFLGRKLFDQSLDSFIQTDAAISFGNSGGPLINGKGQVVGITTAVSAQASNIGFAIPINQVIAILPQLRERGRVSRGFMGVDLTDLTPQLRRALRLEPERGAFVQDVAPDTPAERAGLRPYDVITKADDRVIPSDDELIRYISGRLPGVLARLEIWREGGRREVTVKLSERPLSQARAKDRRGSPAVQPTASGEAPLGLTVRDLDAATARRLSIPDSIAGVLIMDVDTAGPARLARIHRGQIVLEINRRPITSAAEFRAIASAFQPGDVAAVFVYDPQSEQRAIHTIVLDPKP